MLVINGDFVDTWAQPHNQRPRDLVGLLFDTPPPVPAGNGSVVDLVGRDPDRLLGAIVVEEIKALIEDGFEVVYVRGNHDDTDLSPRQLQRIFGYHAVTVIGKRSNGYWYHVPASLSPYFPITIGHGHTVDHYNILPLHSALSYPFGYYLTRLCSSWDFYDTWRIMLHANDFLNFRVETLLVSVYNMICSHVGEAPITEFELDKRFFVMPDGSKKSFKTVVDEFQYLQEEAEASLMLSCVVYPLLSEERLRECIKAGAASFMLDQFALDKLTADPATRILVLGHTHTAIMSKVVSKTTYEKQVYANSASIRDTGESTFVKIAVDNVNAMARASLYSLTEEAVTLRESEKLLVYY
eukprot:TRINITY_DN3321_c0_g1_i1.p1 TRINITY_DN3321_c0_g1~~TRINITY_DN3321_c0_g1_i1.p1  ORF type:complete len:354 (+),score=93.11 TRINITY_DN3321_c0_g1_i1:479-1540(+)